jgi:hypothetical protein
LLWWGTCELSVIQPEPDASPVQQNVARIEGVSETLARLPLSWLLEIPVCHFEEWRLDCHFQADVEIKGSSPILPVKTGWTEATLAVALVVEDEPLFGSGNRAGKDCLHKGRPKL